MAIFITGIGTDVGKTIAAAVVVEALEADYWKPIQAGDINNGDTQKVQRWVSNGRSVFYPNAYQLQTAASPHLAAAIDGVCIEKSAIVRPETANVLVIEGAGGLLVPINEKEFVVDLIAPNDQVILVSRHYLGSINHTLLSIACLKSRGLSVSGLLFSGDENKASESIIASQTGVPVIGRIEEEPYFDKMVVAYYADLFSDFLKQMLI
ncbi:dethiobiotin synthase [Flavobacterium branchiophilum]|uniref:ATP-dependent dethiobiotin synthetase BioD n=1 Tax=Flavobacterium branchiophilum (strain FL-15) TaxID=1034807 RepID=G2Z4W6_FLABF|nr:dethiobiotin synthase [Flavobacterium branchiophilum]CCB70678.1 Dethiobiotin synthetase [Flavobacterium branchiophilum FL-15]